MKDPGQVRWNKYSIEIMNCPPEFPSTSKAPIKLVYMLFDPPTVVSVTTGSQDTCGSSTYFMAEMRDGTALLEDRFSFETDGVTATLTTLESKSESIVGEYWIYIYEIDSFFPEFFDITPIKITIGNGRCKPDFNGPDEVDDEYEYHIGKDASLVIKFKEASNGNCWFDSEMEVDGPSDDVYLFMPPIQVQDA